MALSWEVCRLRESSASISIANNKVDTKENRTWSVNYLVIAHGVSSPFDVSEISAMRAPGVPILRRSVYVDPDGTVFPYFSCKNKTCERSTENSYVFEVACEYTDPEGEEGEQPPANAEDYSPKITWDIKIRKETLWYDEDDQTYALPNGSLHKAPLVGEYACFVAKVSQIEASFDKDDLKDRMLKLNSSTWQDMDPHTALVTDIDYQEIEVPIAGGLTQVAYRVNYTIEENNLVMRGMKGNLRNAEGYTVIDYDVNWGVARPLIDTKYITTVPDGQGGFKEIVKVANSVFPNVTNVALKHDGELLLYPGKPGVPWAEHPPALQVFRVYNDIDYSAFLDV